MLELLRGAWEAEKAESVTDDARTYSFAVPQPAECYTVCTNSSNTSDVTVGPGECSWAGDRWPLSSTEVYEDIRRTRDATMLAAPHLTGSEGWRKVYCERSSGYDLQTASMAC